MGGLGLFLTQGGSTKTYHAPKAAPVDGAQVVIVEAPVLPDLEWDTNLFEKTNAERKKVGSPDLTNDPALAAVAHSRAVEMAKNRNLSHTSPSGETAVMAMAAAHYGSATNAENLARVDKGETTADTMKSFMNSPRHHDAILDKSFQAIGIDSLVGDDGLRYVVVLFSGTTAGPTDRVGLDSWLADSAWAARRTDRAAAGRASGRCATSSTGALAQRGVLLEYRLNACLSGVHRLAEDAARV